MHYMYINERDEVLALSEPQVNQARFFRLMNGEGWCTLISASRRSQKSLNFSINL